MVGGRGGDPAARKLPIPAVCGSHLPGPLAVSPPDDGGSKFPKAGTLESARAGVWPGDIPRAGNGQISPPVFQEDLCLRCNSRQ